MCQFIETLEEIIKDRKHNPVPGSYTTSLFEKGIDRILKKINRGHTFAQSCDAMRVLKDNCFKHVFLRPGFSAHCIYGFFPPPTLVKTLAENLTENLVNNLCGLFDSFAIF